MHKRKAIRYALVRLLSGRTDVAARVYPNRPTPLWTQELPCICIYTAREPASLLTRPTIYKRDLDVVIECVCRADDTMDDVLDDLALQVETVLGDHEILTDEDEQKYDFVECLELVGTDITISAEGEDIVGSCKITLAIPYKAGLGEFVDSDAVDEFETADAKHETTGGADAEDLFDVRPT